ncbi:MULTISPECIES: heavy-metal-associated domain-containing protein [Chitinophagaceae]
MKTLKFQTTLKCSGCVDKVKADLDADKNIENWNVDLQNNPKILTVTGDNITSEEIEHILQKSGYKASLVK